MLLILPNDVRQRTLEDDSEVKAPLFCKTVTAAASFVIEIANRFSSWTKLVHCIAWVRRFHRNLKQGLKSSMKSEMTRVCLCISEIHEFENNIWSLIQKDLLGAEIKMLSSNDEAHVS